MKESEVKHTKFNLWIWKNLPQCKEMVKVITTSMDAKISWRQWLVLKIHLLSCDPCVNFIKQLKLIRTALLGGYSRLEEADQSVKLTEEARARMKSILAASQAGPE